MLYNGCCAGCGAALAADNCSYCLRVAVKPAVKKASLAIFDEIVGDSMRSRAVEIAENHMQHLRMLTDIYEMRLGR